MKRYRSRAARKRNAVGAKRRRGVRKLQGVTSVMYKRRHPSVTGEAYASSMGLRTARRGPFTRRRPPSKRFRTATRIVGGDMSMSKLMWRPYRPNSLTSVVRTLNKQSFTIVSRYQACKRMNVLNTGTNIPGQLALHNTYDVAIGGSSCPLHMFELTGLSPVQLVASEPVGYYMNVTDSGTTGFVPMNGTSSDGSVDITGQWQLERLSNHVGLGVNQTYLSRFVTTEWFDIRLNLYGCNTQPTVYDVMLVQPTEMYALRDVLDAGLDTENLRNNFWQGMVKGMTYNPVIPGNNGWRKGCRVIRSWRRIINPSNPYGSSDVVDKNPHNHVLRIKYSDNRTRDYAYVEAAPSTDTLALANGWVVSGVNNAVIKAQPKPKARLMLVVRAQNTTPVAEGVATAANTPSYDIVIRRKQRVVDARSGTGF